jgi:beta-N-acetylhexosaminidase
MTQAMTQTKTQSIEQLALRVQLPAFPGTTLAPEVADLLAAGLGGVCLFGSNTAAGPEGTAQLTAAVHQASSRAVVAIDEEGGDVTRLHARSGSPVLGPAALGAADDLDLTRDTGRQVGGELVAAGVDLDLAPVADVNCNPDNPVIGTRSFGADPGRAADHVVAWVLGLQETGVAACVKHFPGHGDTAQDSHVDLPTVDAGLDVLVQRELVPFAAAVDAGVAAVMTSHLLVPAVDPDLPATLSPRVLALLRDRLGFTGAIVTDALDMAGASRGRGIPEAAVLSLVAGADLLCLGADKDVALVLEVQAAVVRAVRSGRLPESRLVEAAARVDALRLRPTQPQPTSTDSLVGAKRAVTVEGVLPDLRGAVVVSVAGRANIAVGDAVWGLPAEGCVVPGPAADLPDGRGPLVVQVRDAHRHAEVGALLRVIERVRPVVVVEWGWPGPYDGRSARICTRGSSLPAVAAVRDLLRSAGWDR